MQQRLTAFEQLKEFLTKRMRMSHLYQPLMLRTLIEKGGSASAPVRCWPSGKARSPLAAGT
jgi:hypothetical protein